MWIVQIFSQIKYYDFQHYINHAGTFIVHVINLLNRKKTNTNMFFIDDAGSAALFVRILEELSWHWKKQNNGTKQNSLHM